MAPNLGCLNAASAKEAAQAGSSWKDRSVDQSVNAQKQHLQEPFIISHSELHLHDGFSSGDHLLDEDDEVIELLMQKEANFTVHKQYADSYEGIDNTHLRESRERAVCWMMTVQAYYGFNPCTTFLAVSNFDRFLANHQEDLLHTSRSAPWLLQLLAVGCMSLAAKAEESEVPLLLDLQVGHMPHMFEARTVQRMELLILSTLKWRLSSVTPFSFLGHLQQKMRSSGRSVCSNLVLRRVEELIVNSYRDPRFVVYTSSVLAMASVIRSCSELLSGQAASSCEEALLTVWPDRKETIMECTRLMQERIVGTYPLCRLIVPANPNSAPESPNGVLDAACFSCESGSTTCNDSSLISACKRRVFPWRSCSAHPTEYCTSFRSAIANVATKHSSSLSAPVCKAIIESGSSSRKRKFNERSYTSSSSTASGTRFKRQRREEAHQLNDCFEESLTQEYGAAQEANL